MQGETPAYGGDQGAPTPPTAPDASPVPMPDKSGRRSFFQRWADRWLCFAKSCIQRKGEFLERVELRYEAYGHSVYDHPWRYIIWPLVICAVCSVGLLWREIELDMVKLYGLPGCLPHVALEHLQGVFPVERIEYIFAVSRDGILTKEKLLALDQMWTKVKLLRVPKALVKESVIPGETEIMGRWLREHQPEILRYEPDWDPAKVEHIPQHPEFISLEEVCVFDGFGTCKMTGILDLYNNRRMYGQPVRTRDWPQFINLRSQRAFRVDSILGDITTEDRPGGTVELRNATSAAFRIDLDGTEDRIDWAAAWEQGLMALIQSMELPGIDLHVKAERSLADELALSSQLKGDDLFMLLVAAVLVSIFTCAMNWSTDNYRSKLFPALAGVATTLFSYGGGVGICHMLGLPHVPPSEATPFIVLAINVDDVFVITNAYSMTYLHSHCSRSRIGMALRDAGISVTLTTVTNIIAFAIGASSVYFSIQIFCIVTASALLVGFLLSLTVFAGALAISARLEEEKRPSSVVQHIRASSAALTNARRPCKGESVGNSVDRVRRARRPSLSLAAFSQPGPARSFVAETTMAAITPRAGELEGRSSLTTTRNLQQLHGVFVRCRSPSPMPPASRLSRRSSLKDAGNHALSRGASSEEVRAVVSRRSVCPTGTRATTEGGREGYFLVEDLSNQYVITKRVEAYFDLLKSQDGSRCESPMVPSIEPVDQGTDPEENCSSPGISSSGTCDVPQEPDSPNAGSAAEAETDWPRTEHNRDGQSFASLALTSVQRNGLAPLPKELNIKKLPHLVRIDDELYPEGAVNLEEPKGTVGRVCREFFMRYVGAVLVLRPVKVVIMTCFLILFAFSIWCSTKVTAGIKVKDVAPMDSYFRDVIDIRESDFDAYGEECVVFFQHGGRWWDPMVQQNVLALTEEIRQDPHVVFVMNGMEDFLLSSYNSETSASLQTDRERKLAFTRGFQEWVESPRGRNYGKFFQRDYDGTPSTAKFYYWMEYTDNSEVSQKWMLRIQQLLQMHDQRGVLTGGEVFTPLALMWESDPIIFGATMWNMMVALGSMGVVALALIPDVKSGGLVLMVILMIYANVYGAMYLWDLPLNMLTMVNLVLAIGFAVDYTAHITHTFNHCKGSTRNARVIETIVIMGLPISNGMLSTYVAIAALSMSTKYTLIVIFKMTTTIIASAFLHGMFFMPVLLSLVGPLNRREVTLVRVQDGTVRDSWAVDLCYQRQIQDAHLETKRLDADLRNFSRWGAFSRKNYGIM